MVLPNLSNSMYVAHLRYIQSIHESPERRNPDTFVGNFLPVLQRIRSAWMSEAKLSELRADPFYYYLIARTRYYDEVVESAVASGAKRIVMIGCGSDTRAYRFKNLLFRHGVTVLECDQAESIQAKQAMARGQRRLENVGYLAIDLNDGKWPELESRLGRRDKPKTLVLMEGVSPYVDAAAFGEFLHLLVTCLVPGSLLAYDFKIAGIKDSFGRQGRTQTPFRLPMRADAVAQFHKLYGMHLEHVESSAELCARVLPSLDPLSAPMFIEDGLVRLRLT